MAYLKLRDVSDSRIRYDKSNNAVRSFFGEDLVKQRPPDWKSGDEDEWASDFLAVNQEKFKLAEASLHEVDRREGSATKSVFYEQRHNGVPVYGASLVVSARKANKNLTSSVNRLDYELPAELGREQAPIGGVEAAERVRAQLLARFGKITLGSPKLFIYRHVALPGAIEPGENERPGERELRELSTATVGTAYLAWQVMVDTGEPSGNWEVLVNAISGEILVARSRRDYVTRKAFVFVPDPITSSGDTTLSSESTAAQLDPLRVEVELENLNEPVGGKFRLDGKWLESRDKEPPHVPVPETSDDFKYSTEDPRFLSVMAYYWLDRLVEYLRGFDVPLFNDAVTTRKLAVDAQGVEGEDDSHFLLCVNNLPRIAFGTGGVADASDAHVIVHEYGHALHDYMMMRQNQEGNEEGFGDFLASAWLDRFNPEQRQRSSVFPWDNNRHEPGHNPERSFRNKRKFSDAGFSDLPYQLKGYVMAATLWDMFLRMGGQSGDEGVRRAAADRSIHIYLEMLLTMVPQAPVKVLAQGLVNADVTLHGGANGPHISAAFKARGVDL